MAQQGTPFDSTPGTFDAQFFVEVCDFIPLLVFRSEIFHRRP